MRTLRHRTWLVSVAVLATLALASFLGCGSDSSAEPGGGGGSGGSGLPDGSVDGSAGSAGCVVKTCAQMAAQCGSLPDNCGGKLECGACQQGQICGGAGANKCGTNECSPKSCAQVGASCGYISDQCSLALDCGTCPSGQTCGGGGVPNQCGSGGSSCSMTLGEVTTDTTIPAGCVVDIKGGNANVLNNATLTIEEGVTVRVASGLRLYVALQGAAKLVVKGSANKPVTFTSAASSPAVGDWTSVYLGDDLMGGTSIDHAVFEYAGADDQPAIEVIPSKPGRISITNTTFRHNAAGGVLNDNLDGTFQSFTGNTFSDNGEWAVKLHANVVGSVGAGNTFGVPIRVVNTSVKATATWLKHDVPYWFESTVNVDDSSVPVLTLESGTEVRFGMGHGLRMGVTYGGALQASNVRFTSSASTGSPGDWEMIWFSDKAGASSLSGCTIEYAGTTGMYPGVLKIDKTVVQKVEVVGTTFQHNLGTVDIQTVGGDCSKYTSASPANKFDLATACE